MKISGSANKTSTLFKPLVLVALATLVMAGCKDSDDQGSSGSPPQAPSSGSSGGSTPPPPSGGGSSGGGTPPPPSGSQGEGGSSGSTGETSSGESGEGGAGEVGSVPPPPGQQGGGGELGGGESGGGESGGDSSSGGGEENPFGDAEESDSEGECGDTGAMPGGIGGMGREGECISDSASASESESQSESSSSSESSSEGSSGGSSGGGSSGGGASGGGASGGGASGGGASGGSNSEGGTGGAGSVGEFPGESSAERAARLGRELDESIGGFDETLGDEQREIAAAGRVVDGFDTEGGGSGGSGGTISLGSQTAPTNPDGGMQGSGSGVQTSPIAGMSQQQIEERTPDDVPTMVDDDIIARQLREAALVEEDPDLRARLWNEYRKYKGQLVAD